MSQINTLSANKNFTFPVVNEKKPSQPFLTGSKVALAAATIGTACLLGVVLKENYPFIKESILGENYSSLVESSTISSYYVFNGTRYHCETTTSVTKDFTPTFFCGTLTNTLKNLTQVCQIFNENEGFLKTAKLLLL